MPNSQPLKTNIASDTLDRSARDTVSAYGMLSPGDTVCVGFSGGADSVALLHWLSCHEREYGITLSAIHIHHGIRGAEADRDAAFCKEFCEARGIRLRLLFRDVPSLCEQSGEGIEECARRVRYEAFDALIAAGEATRIATAHHAADNLETLLMALARGSSLRGACGIPPVRGAVIRPLLACTKAQITAYLAEQKLSFVTDSTNADEGYTRNRLRAQVLPVLEGINDGLYRHITDFCTGSREDEEYLAQIAQKEKTDRIPDLQVMSASILKRVLALLWKERSDALLDRVHLSALSALVRDGSQGARRSMPDGLTATVDRGRLVFAKNSCGREFCYPLVMGENDFPDLGCKIILSEQRISEDSLNIYKKLIHTSIKSDRINTVFVRSREAGDAYRTMGLTRRVKKLLQQDKLTQREREVMPVFCDDAGILWVPGHGVRDGAWTKDGLHIYYCSGEKD